jgi:hypothetical protein
MYIYRFQSFASYHPIIYVVTKILIYMDPSIIYVVTKILIYMDPSKKKHLALVLYTLVSK